MKNHLIAKIALIVSLLASAVVQAQQSAEPYTSATRYNLARQVTATIQPDPDGTGPLKYPATRNTYDPVTGLLARTETGYLDSWKDETEKPEDWSASEFHVSAVQEFTYDGKSRKAIEITRDASGNAYARTEYSYDQYGRVECKTVRMNPARFDDAYNASSVCATGTAGSYGEDRVTRFVYDIYDNVIEEHRAVDTDLEQIYAQYTYEEQGTLRTSVTDANGNYAEMEYDNYGRMTKWKFPSKNMEGVVSSDDYEEYDYDANGNRIYLRKRDGSEIDYVYDNLNRLQKKDFRDTYMPDVYYGYDLRDLQTYARFGSTTGTGVTTTYTGFGELNTETHRLGGTNYTVSHLYDKNGNRTRVTHPDGKYFTYQYDGLDRLAGIYEQGSTQLIQKTYDQYARPLQQTTAGNAATTVGYDDISRIGSIDYAVGGGSYDLNIGFNYNPANQITGRDISNDNYDYKGPGGKTGGYFVNGLNQYVTVGAASYAYDDNGNLILDGERDYIYDVENRLIHAQDQATTVALEYDPNGRLIEYEVDGSATYFLYDGDNLVAEIQNDAIAKRYVHAGNMGTPVASYTGSAVGSANRVFLHKDYQGSVIAATGNAGFVEFVNRYDAYGVPDTGNQGRFGYTGQMYLAELGLYHYRARVYDPDVGRFLQTDPVGYADQMNLYAYVHNDPLNGTDPTGMQSDFDEEVIVTGHGNNTSSNCSCMVGQAAVDWVRSQNNRIQSYAGMAAMVASPWSIWMANESNSGDEDGVTIEDDGSGTSIITIDTPNGEVEVIGGISSDGETVTIGSPESGAHIEGPGAGSLGLSGTKDLGKRVGRKLGVKTVKIYGGTRTTGANPGKQPRPITIKVD